MAICCSSIWVFAIPLLIVGISMVVGGIAAIIRNRRFPKVKPFEMTIEEEKTINEILEEHIDEINERLGIHK